MEKMIVRIEEIELFNYKNVKHGCLSLNNIANGKKANLLGLYGQNGSGKTALIEAMGLLKSALTFQPLQNSIVDSINLDANYATFVFTFLVSAPHGKSNYKVKYEFSVKKTTTDSENTDSFNLDDSAANPQKFRPCIFNEVLSYSYLDDDVKKIFSTVVNTNTSEEKAFEPTTKYETLMGKNKSVLTNLIVAKEVAKNTSRSFVFSNTFIKTLKENCKEKYHISLFESLIWYGNYELFVISTSNSGLISMNALPLLFNYEEKNTFSTGSLMINLNGPTLIPSAALTIVKKVVNSMNVVLPQLIPNLTISIKELGVELMPNGITGTKIQLASCKNGDEIPLKNESEGIKKIISILQLLIVVYNKPSITVAIDELDSGVFEYLLGELLKIISEKGKGQLFFTSHNLRPLETLNRNFIAFTTTNPDNRYIRLTNVKSNNNLRDVYYRNIILDVQNEMIYEPTNNYEIALAFREAGAKHV